MHNRYQTRSLVKEPLILLEQEFAAITDRHDAQRGPFLLAEDLPGDNVGVMLHMRDDDLIARLDMCSAEALSDEVDPFGGAAHKNDLAGLGGVKELLHLDARRFVIFGGLLTKPVHAAMDVGVFCLVKPID